MRRVGNWWIVQINKNGYWDDAGMFDTLLEAEILIRKYALVNHLPTISYRYRKSGEEYRDEKTLRLV